MRRKVDQQVLPSPVLVSPASPEATRTFFAKAWPDVLAIGDEGKKLYDAFKVGRGGWRSMAGFRVWGAAFRAMMKGHGIGLPNGDPFMMSGAFLVRGDEVLIGRASEHSGDLPLLLDSLAERSGKDDAQRGEQSCNR